MLKNLKQFSLPEVEEKVLKFWKEKGVKEKSFKVSKLKKRRRFVFYEGPPTANGRPGIHHVLARAFKDIVLRYKAMRGFYVPRRGGWDTHGLPVELEVEKELGLNSKKQIEEYGIEEFNKKCRESVWKYKEEWERLTDRIGFWLDLENPYITYESEYIEKLWGILKEAWKKKLLYNGHKVLPWCPRCGTALSSHEMAQGYKEVTDNSVYVKFRLEKGQSFKVSKFQSSKEEKFVTDENACILSWTTTPWTLPGNVALAVGKQITYVICGIKKDGEYFILAKDRVSDVLGDLEYEVVGEVVGEDLIGLEYEQLFDVKSLRNDKSRRVYEADFVNTEEGTGVVHTAVMYGEDDYVLGQEIGLPQHHTVDEDGRFTGEVRELKGGYVRDRETEKTIFDHLEVEGYFLGKEPYSHDYPHCWRCSTPLIYYARNSWFIAMSKLRDRLLKENSKINWFPSHVKEGRFGEWLRDVKDWAISRDRYWGTPLPIWKCEAEKCDGIAVVGSIGELEKLSGEKAEDLHRPYVDEVTFECKECEGVMRRVPEVVDAWFDSGSMPFAAAQVKSSRFKVQNLGKGLDYPADYICEAVDQTRGWFYTLLAVAVLLGKKSPYRNVISLGHILDGQGQKMSKSKGNVVDPWDMVGKYGADVVRWHFYTVNPPGEPKRFDEAELGKVMRQFFMMAYNSFVFYDTYADGSSKFKVQSSKFTHVLDRWIVARLQEAICLVSDGLDGYDITGAARVLEDFVQDLSRWYIRRSRRRFQKPVGDEDYNMASQTLGYVLLGFSKLLAPFAPFFAESLYRSLGQGDSVHLTEWPGVHKRFFDEKLLDGMREVRRVAALGLAKRAEAGIKVRQPLAALKLKVRSSKSKVTDELLGVLKDEVNVKEVVFDESINEEVELDTEITHELMEEGLLREFTRAVQGMRQDGGLEPKDKIVLSVHAERELGSVLRRNEDFVKKEVSANMIEYGRKDKFDVELETGIGKKGVWIGIRRI